MPEHKRFHILQKCVLALIFKTGLCTHLNDAIVNLAPSSPL